MPRKKRNWNPLFFNHVVMRGNNRQNIFTNDEDFRELFRIFYYAFNKYPFIISSYCIMSNHYHLLIRSPEVPLSNIMRIVNKRYCDYFRKKYNYYGHLYEQRYFAELVSTPKSILNVSRYIHRNPIQTKQPIVTEMENYPYSSYSLFKNGQISPYPFIDTKPILSCFNFPSNQTSEDYCRFCETEDE